MSESEQQKASEEIIEQLRAYEEILNKLPIAIFKKDHDCKFTWCNEAFAKMAQAQPEDIIGKDDWAFYQTPFATKYQMEDKEVLESGKPTSSHEILQMSDKEERYIRTLKIPLYVGEKPASLLGVFMDIGSDAPLKALLDARAQTISQAEQQLSALVPRDDSLKREPRVFISYKHASDDHQSWVRKLATDLIEQYGIHCILDQFDLDFGDSIPAYMQRIQTEATHVLFIITPECTKAVESSSGGVSFEIQLATSLRERGQLRIIPVLRSGNQSPAYVRAHLYIDFRDDNVYPDVLRRLADSIRYGKIRPIPNSRPPRKPKKNT